MKDKNTVFIAVKSTDDSLAQLGLSKETDDYSITCEICKKLNTLLIETYIKDVGISCSEEDTRVLSDAKVLVVVATREVYLNAAQKVIDSYERKAENKIKKIVYLCAESVGEMNPRDFPTDTQNRYLSAEAYELSRRNTISMFVEDIYTYLNSDTEDRIVFSVKNILKNSCSTLPFFSNVIERKWLDEILDKWLKNGGNRHICWICGDHGSGKTVFVGDYCAHLKDVAGKGIYYCRCSSRETQNIERIIKAIAYELSSSIDGYANVIYQIVSDEHFRSRNAEELFPALLINPFNDYPELCPANGKIVFVIDGVDELKTDKTDALTLFLELLRNFAQSLPHFFRLIITSPAIDSISNTMKQLSVKTVNFSENKHQMRKRNDAERFLRLELDNRGIQYSDDDIQKVLEKSEWNFDYLHYFLDQCDEEDDEILPPLDDLPKGLTAMFEVDFNNRFSDDFYNNKVKPILQILAATYEPLSVTDLSEILLANINETQSIIKGQLRQFLKFLNESNQDEKVSLYNRSIELWLIKNNHKYCINVTEGTKAVVKWFNNKSGHFYENEYLRRYGLLHVLESKDYKIVEKLIIESKADDFEKLKEELSALFISNCTNRVNVTSELLYIYRINYDKTIRIRDILVYTYRYVLKRKGANAFGLHEICSLLKEKNEIVRANLLIGEGINEYVSAKKHFEDTIKQAADLVEKPEGNIWWNKRMLGVAYNRLANLENKAGYTHEAMYQYNNGKRCFDEAIDVLEKDYKQLNDFRDDYNILQRDEAIINERLGDLAFKDKDYNNANMYYSSYYDACNRTYNSEPTLSTKWDLSISLLRLGDTKRYLGRLQEAQDKYKIALDLRRDILQHMRNDCINIISNGSRSYYKDFECPESMDGLEILKDEIPKESRDIEPIRDIAMCYIRLGDLAFDLGIINIAKFYYDILVKLCEKNNAEVRTENTENDLMISKKRRDRIQE